MTDIQLSITPEKNKSFVGNLAFSVFEAANATIVTLYPDSASGGYYPLSYQDVQYDGNYFYIGLTFNGAAGDDVSFIIKISEDFTTTYSKLYYEKDAKMFFNTNAKDTIMVLSSHNPDYSSYFGPGYRHHYFVYYSENAGTHLDPIGPYYDEKHYLVSGSPGRELYPNGLILDASDNIVIYGLSVGTRYNYIRYDAAGNYQFAGRLGYTRVLKAIYANSAMYAIGDGEQVQKIDITTDTIDASYTYADSAQSSINYQDLIYNANGKIVVVGNQVDGAGTRTGLIYQAEGDLSVLNYNVTITKDNNFRYEGVCEYDGFIFATGYYVDGSGNTHGVVSKFSLADLTHVSTLKLSNDQNYLILRNPSEANGNLVIYGLSKKASGDYEGLIVKISSSNISTLTLATDPTGTFTFSDLTVSETNPATASWAVNGLTMTTSTIDDRYTSTEDSIDRVTDKTTYNIT